MPRLSGDSAKASTVRQNRYSVTVTTTQVVTLTAGASCTIVVGHASGMSRTARPSPSMARIGK